MNKVYLVWIESGMMEDYQYKLHDVFSSENLAEKVKKQLEDRIQNIKTLYYLEYNSDYNTDLESLQIGGLILEDEELYNKLVERVYNYQYNHEELNYSKIVIEEREVK